MKKPILKKFKLMTKMMPSGLLMMIQILKKKNQFRWRNLTKKINNNKVLINGEREKILFLNMLK